MRLQSLSEDIYFKWILRISFFLGVGSMLIIAAAEKRCPCVTSTCFEEFLVLFKFPFQVFTAGVALGAVRGMVFRSEQTAKQINETIKQNTYKNYFEHKKDFFDLLKSLEDSYKVVFIDKKYLYEKLFPQNSPANFDVISKAADGNSPSLEIWIKNYNNAVNLLNKNPDNYLTYENSKYFIGWLAGFSSEINNSYIEFSDQLRFYSVSSLHDKSRIFSDIQKLNKFPADLYGSISNIGKIYGILCNYCFMRSDYIVIDTLSVNEARLNGQLEYVCGEFEIE